MWIAYRIGIAAIALVALIALFVCQYRLSSRISQRDVPRRESDTARSGAGGVHSSDVANWN